MADNRRQYDSSSVVLPGIRRIQGASTASALDIVNVPLPGVAGTEFTYTFPEGTKAFTIKTRGNAVLQVGTTVGSSGTTYWKILGGNCLPSAELNVPLSGLTLYLQSPKTGDTVEILIWK